MTTLREKIEALKGKTRHSGKAEYMAIKVVNEVLSLLDEEMEGKVILTTGQLQEILFLDGYDDTPDWIKAMLEASQ